jgi:hypothetical protein
MRGGPDDLLTARSATMVDGPDNGRYGDLL